MVNIHYFNYWLIECREESEAIILPDVDACMHVKYFPIVFLQVDYLASFSLIFQQAPFLIDYTLQSIKN